jgi:cobalt/nickel transport system permease protein
MHIPDGYLSPQTYIPLYGVSITFWGISLRKIKKFLSSKEMPFIAMASAFSFIVMMFNIPIPGGTSGHIVGAAIIAIVLGPWTAVISVSVVLIIQALVFGDGGITAIGANSFNMAVVMPFISYGVFKLINGNSGKGVRTYIAAFASGYIGISFAALFAAVELGIQPLIAHSAEGTPLYAPYPLSITIPAILLEHLLLFGIIEGIVTALLLKYFLTAKPDMIYAARKI